MLQACRNGIIQDSSMVLLFEHHQFLKSVSGVLGISGFVLSF